MPDFDHDRARIHYDVTGEGPPLLLIAGTASDGASWAPLLPLLGGRRLILIDNRGSGRTRVEGPIALAEMAEDCAALLRHLGFGAVDIVGHSLGGFIGLMLAERHPALVRRLVTMGSGPLDAKGRVLFDDLARLYFTVPPEDWFRLLYQWLFSAPFFADEGNVAAAARASTEYAYRQSPGDFARQIAAGRRGGPTDLTRIGCPVLALAGALDLLAPPRAVEDLHRALPDIRHEVIAGAAHAIHWEQPAATAAAIARFLA